MKKILLICLVIFVTSISGLNFSDRGLLLKHYPTPPPESYERDSRAITVEYFSQKLDHFQPTNTNFWSQRYFVNPDYFDTTERNVVFLMIAGEATASSGWMAYGPWVASARKYNALLFQLEHRFYGESQPFADISLENLRYLTSEQALADTANFIVAMNKKYELSSDVKWIVFGGSYAGSLAAWMRQKYPHLVHGAMDSSGPLLAKLDFHEYMQVVADDLAASSQECADTVKVAIDQVESLLQNPGDETVTSLFNLCNPIEEQLDNFFNMAYLFKSITILFAATAQYHNIPGLTTNIDDLCDVLADETIGTEIHRLATLNRQYFGSACLDIDYDGLVDYYKNINDIAAGSRQWIFQTCTEYGWYQTSNQEDPVFSNRFPLDFNTGICAGVFGEKFNETFISQQIVQTNTDYGALDIETSNIVHLHGTLDPWHAMGLTNTTNPESPVILINGAAHCSNMYEQSATDPPELIAARVEVDRLIGVWLEK